MANKTKNNECTFTIFMRNFCIILLDDFEFCFHIIRIIIGIGIGGLTFMWYIVFITSFI